MRSSPLTPGSGARLASMKTRVFQLKEEMAHCSSKMTEQETRFLTPLAAQRDCNHHAPGTGAAVPGFGDYFQRHHEVIQTYRKVARRVKKKIPYTLHPDTLLIFCHI